MHERVSVIVVDDEMISRGYMELFIKPSRKYEVIASLPFASDALFWCREDGKPIPDLVLMDVMMASGIDGLTAAGKIKEEFPSVRIIITTSMADADWLDKARDAGIEGFWFKNYPDMPLLDVMDKVMAGESVYPDEAPDLTLGRLPASRLTRQQRSILRELTEGFSNREIARILHLSPNTVKDYLDDLMEKSGIHSRTALAAQASRLGIVVSETERTQAGTV